MNESEKLAQQGLNHVQQGQLAEAESCFRQALASEPENGAYWNFLAKVLHHKQDFAEALEAYDKALEYQGAAAKEIHYNRATILAQQIKDPRQAAEEYRAALETDPEFHPALVGLGQVSEELGDKASAADAYQNALKSQPDNLFVMTRLAILSDFQSAEDPLITRLAEHMDRPGQNPAAKAAIGFSLGRAYDSLGQYDEAFATYSAANEALKAEPGRRGHNRRLEEEYTDRLIAAYSKPVTNAGSPAASEEEKPIFVCGMFRSGSTLAERILSRHSRVTPGGEMELVLSIVQHGFDRYPHDAPRAHPDRIARHRDGYLQRLEELNPGADLVVDKQPFNFRHIGLIKQIFPNAKIIDTVRNPIDNCLAMYFASFTSEVPFAADLGDLVHWYKDYRRLMAHWHTVYPGSIHTLDYDALVTEPEPAIRELVQYCGLEWEDACLEPHKADTAVRTLSAWQVQQPLYQKSSGRWRNYEKHIGELLEAFPQD